MKNRTYQLIVVTNNIVHTVWIDSEHDLIQHFKDARLQGDKFISWKHGCLYTDSIVGIYRHADSDEL